MTVARTSAMTTRTLLLPIAILVLAAVARAQDLDNVLNTLTTPATEYASASFKATRIINGQSIEQMHEGQLDFRIHHRFGPVNSGPYELWGLDQSNIFLGFEYGLTDWLELGIGRSSYQKTYSGFAKFRVLTQSTGEKNNPVTLSLFGGADCFSTRWSNPDLTHYFADRLSVVAQALIARKFTEDLSLQISPTIVHRNLVPTELDHNDTYAIGFGGRYKLSTRVSVNAEYFLTILPSVEGRTNNPNSLSVGVDIETGGHVFQIMLTNSLPMIERGFIAETTESWSDGGIHLGFNISRVFTLF
jgi:hypothetical protein